HLKGQQYSWVGSIFYFGYLVWEYPTTILIACLPTGKYLAANTVFWGAVVALTAACTSFGGLMVVRFLLGMAEATITPGFMFLTSTWYTRDEMPTRVGIWFAGNSVGGLAASLLAFGIGHIKDDVHPWRWMYIILGAATFLWSIPMFLFLPDSIDKAKFLTPEERQVAAERVVIAGTGSTENSRWKREQVVECLVDPKSWLIFSINLLSQIPNGSTQSFSNIVVESFGFTNLQSTLINIPYSVITAGVIYGTGHLSGRFRTLNCLLIVAVVLPCVVGAGVIYARDRVSHRVQLFAYFLLSTGPAAMPLTMALVQSNYRGVTKKMTITAMLFVAYCTGNISGPQLFRKQEAPAYATAFRAIMICYALVILLVVVLRLYLQWTNARRTREEGFEGNAGAAGAMADGKVPSALDDRNVADALTEVQLRPEDYEDVTDWKTVGFRYPLIKVYHQHNAATVPLHLTSASLRPAQHPQTERTGKMAWRNQGITGSNNIPLGKSRRFGGELEEDGVDRDRDLKRGRDPEPRSDADGPRRRKKRNRWGEASENKAAGLMGLPTAIMSNMTSEQLEAYTLHLRIEEISQKLRIDDVVPADGDRSPSPAPQYDNHGRRINTREYRYRKRLEDERHKLIERAMKTIPNYHPPQDYRRPTKTQEKVYVPVNDYPEINFIGLLIGPRGNTLKKMEQDSGAKIAIRGKGSVKEGKGRSDAAHSSNQEEDLHCLIMADTEEKINKAKQLIHNVIETQLMQELGGGSGAAPAQIEAGPGGGQENGDAKPWQRAPTGGPAPWRSRNQDANDGGSGGGSGGSAAPWARERTRGHESQTDSYYGQAYGSAPGAGAPGAAAPPAPSGATGWHQPPAVGAQNGYPGYPGYGGYGAAPGLGAPPGMGAAPGPPPGLPPAGLSAPPGLGGVNALIQQYSGGAPPPPPPSGEAPPPPPPSNQPPPPPPLGA
ncbi:Uncharacterized protein TCAP_03200, partial [Tolypocladium capitatum]